MNEEERHVECGWSASWVKGRERARRNSKWGGRMKSGRAVHLETRNCARELHCASRVVAAGGRESSKIKKREQAGNAKKKQKSSRSSTSRALDGRGAACLPADQYSRETRVRDQDILGSTFIICVSDYHLKCYYGHRSLGGNRSIMEHRLLVTCMYT